jgi:(2Fe-2S) ferredoxin
VAPAPARTALIVVGRGSSDPDANGELYRVARLVAEGDPWAAVVPAFAGVTSPDLPAALELAARARPERIAVVPYLLFAGRVLTKLRDQLAAFTARTPWVPATLAEPLGVDASVIAAVADRAREALGGGRDLACDACQYRVPIAGAVERVGGLRALLYSVRHQVTHSQAAPHVHAHRPLDKHILVCGNADCADRGSLELVVALRQQIKAAGRERTLRVTRTACMGRCGEGPTVAVYPDGVWYRGVRSSDAPELVREHLLADRLVARLVDSVLP